MEFTRTCSEMLVHSRIWIWKCWFLRRRKNPSTQTKPLWEVQRANNKLNPHMTPRLPIEPWTHQWEASVLNPAPCSRNERFALQMIITFYAMHHSVKNNIISHPLFMKAPSLWMFRSTPSICSDPKHSKKRKLKMFLLIPCQACIYFLFLQHKGRLTWIESQVSVRYKCCIQNKSWQGW